MCSRAPLVMTEDLLKDLAQYKNYRERSVMMAAKSLIHVYRSSMPHLLHKKDRVINSSLNKSYISILFKYYYYLQGRPTEATLEIVARKYGEVDAKEFVPGAEILLETEKSESGDDSDQSDEEWVNVSHSEDEIDDAEDAVDEEGESEEDEEDEENISDSEDINETDQSTNLQESLTTEIATPKKKVVSKKEQLAEKKEKAAQVSSMRILTDEDFKRIEIAQLSKQMTSAKNRKRPAESEGTSRY